jgi:hypothetical protein
MAAEPIAQPSVRRSRTGTPLGWEEEAQMSANTLFLDVAAKHNSSSNLASPRLAAVGGNHSAKDSCTNRKAATAFNLLKQSSKLW